MKRSAIACVLVIVPLAESPGRADRQDQHHPNLLNLWVPKTCVTWADPLRNAVSSVKRPASAGPVLAWPRGVG